MSPFGPVFDSALQSIERLSGDKTRLEIVLREAQGALEYAARRSDVVTSNTLASTIEKIAATLSDQPLVREGML